MPDTIYDELAWRTGWFSITDNTGTWWGRADDKSVRLTQHPYATIDGIDAEFRRRGWVWYADAGVFACDLPKATEVVDRTDDTRHDLATLLLRCVQQCSELGSRAKSARTPASEGEGGGCVEC